MKRLKNRYLFRMYEYIQPFINYSIPKEEAIYGKKVLVIAPHQDDEAVGCAGTLIKHSKAGGCVEIAFCTHDTFERMKEAEQAAKIIGSKRNHFMQFAARSLSGNKDFEDALTLLINKVNPDVIFIPFFFDKHNDHTAISQVLVNIKKKINLKFMVYCYAIWSPLNPNCLFDISDVWELKKQTIECYRTQIVSRDYVKIARGLNQYWGELKEHNMQYAETFFMMTIREYISLWNKVFK
ncbi:MAG: PIG-L family deacetylase [Endomicrobium sp.]|uniref:PIG-L deacetylase family protein n=1 Tax=Candidatus Endomicrobiellum pyrsonymphae TaxID=1408203 RepID=UPI003579D069|nr:PIG-L family deacetylase [Endomicrobium sp.]